MLLHVIWGFVEETTQECPTFSVSGMVLRWADRTPAHVRQGRFEWRHEAWEADVEVCGSGASSQRAAGLMRLYPDVVQSWLARSLNPRGEAARQLREAIQQRGSTGQLGVITLTE